MNIFIWVTLTLSVYVRCSTAQGKKLFCSFSPSKTDLIGYQPENIPLEVCPDVIFKAFSFPSIVGRQILFSDNEKIGFSRVVSSVRKRSNTARIVASIDGTARDFATTSIAIVRRKAFVQAAVELLLELDADAIELNWKASSNSANDRSTMVQLLQDLRQAVNAASKSRNRTRELWFRGSLHPSLLADAYNIFDVCELVDHVTLDPSTAESLENSHAPLYGTPQELGMYIPNIGNIYYPKTGFLCKYIREAGWSYAWDGYGGMPYVTRALQNGQVERISYEDLDSLRLKMDMVEQKRFGGIYIDYVHSDDIYGSCGQAYTLTTYLSRRVRTIPSDIGFAIEWN
ncbi:uncharacterized protein LOC120905128 [Anopheles arabiensis]|uniref:uncharacterized protein LOC120905128 n=1 Tax=Anopheles arabiensis TaxID=7173 RepID=UPI001AACB94B|nr:uncharacterized protein LOC120905128 [Anopheles arabiensis]